MVKRWWFLGGLWLALVLAGGADAAAQATAEGQSIGRPSTEALASARGKESAIRDAKGPDSVTLTPNEMASLVKANLDLSAKRALDSIRIRLQPGRLAIDAILLIVSCTVSKSGRADREPVRRPPCRRPRDLTMRPRRTNRGPQAARSLRTKSLLQ